MTQSEVTLSVHGPISTGDRIHLSLAGSGAPLGKVTADTLPALKVGDCLRIDNVELLVVSKSWKPGEDGAASGALYLLEAKNDLREGVYSCVVERKGYALAWITLSDKGAAGKRTDESGPLIGDLVGEKLELAHVQGFIIPDEELQLKGLLANLALEQGFDLILTTGGTGVGPRDVTPEATLAVIEKRLPGFERAMTAASLTKTPHGAISRAVAGTLGQAIIVNMPGSPKAVAECLEPLLPTFKHTLEKLQGDPSDCAVLRK